jgi:hypothetical protein
VGGGGATSPHGAFSVYFIIIYLMYNNNNMNCLDLLRVYHFDTSKKIRLGVNNDGGYVIADIAGAAADAAAASVEGVYDCYISAGVSNEESFTRDFLKRYSGPCSLNETNCFAFDGTIVAYPTQYTDKITFFKKNIGGGEVDTDALTNLRFVLDKYSRVFLKMDIEGGEYPWLMRMTADDLRKIRQLVIEFHGITGTGWGSSFEDKWACINKLSETHYFVHAHGNNYSHTISHIPDVIELTCIEKSYFADSGVPPLNKSPLPILGLDFANCSARHDIDLNVYPFVSKD